MTTEEEIIHITILPDVKSETKFIATESVPKVNAEIIASVLSKSTQLTGADWPTGQAMFSHAAVWNI